MSFLGSIGHLIAGSGLQELLEIIYANNTVTHILSGKAVARAVRGHFLVDRALNILLSAKTFGTDIEDTELESESSIHNTIKAISGNVTNDVHLQELAILYNELMISEISGNNEALDGVLTIVLEKIR